MHIDKFTKNFIVPAKASEGFVDNEKFYDSLQTQISLLPFTSNTSSSNFDNKCSLRGITGEFFRKCSEFDVNAVHDYAVDVEDPVSQYLSQNSMTPEKIKKFNDIMRDLMYDQNHFVPIDSTFLKYIPVDSIVKNNKLTTSKYGDGQKKLADYIFSMYNSVIKLEDSSSRNNLFSKSIKDALNSKVANLASNKSDYYILPFVKMQFSRDIQWFLKKQDYVILKYIDLLLYFYACYSVVQTILKLDVRKFLKSLDQPEDLYYILNNESASKKRDVVTCGWSAKMSNQYVQKLFGRIQAIDILNLVLAEEDSEVIGLYPDILNKLNEKPFVEEKDKCEELLKKYKEKKLELINHRKTSKKIVASQLSDTEVNSYEEFLCKLETLCKQLISSEYEGKMLNRVNNLMKVRLLQTRQGRGSSVLVLDEDMLIFLIAMVTKEERCKLKDMYDKFKEYGIRFDLHTRQAIEEQLLKLNILERKSDSGEAQYVRIVL